MTFINPHGDLIGVEQIEKELLMNFSLYLPRILIYISLISIQNSSFLQT